MSDDPDSAGGGNSDEGQAWRLDPQRSRTSADASMMTSSTPTSASSNRSASPTSGPQDPDILDDAGVSECLGESFANALDLKTWNEGFGDIAQMMDRTAREVEDARRFETEVQKHVRTTIFPWLRTSNRQGAPTDAGVWVAPLDEIARFQRGVLFNGQAEACDGSIQVFETLALTIVQIAVAKVSYETDGGTWSHRLYWRDLRVKKLEDIGARLGELLQIRRSGEGSARQGGRQKNPGKVSELLRRGMMAYAERAVLLNESTAEWRIGHGNIAPYELLTGSGSMELLCAGLDVLTNLVLDHQRFLFVPSDPSGGDLLTLGHALHPLEYAIVNTGEQQMFRIVSTGKYAPEFKERALKFVKEAGPKIVAGVYRASAYGPPHIFYAHEDWVHDAATLAIADSRIQEHRSFPMLIDLADGVCGATFDGTSFRSAIETTYSEKGVPYEFLRERDTRTQ